MQAERARGSWCCAPAHSGRRRSHSDAPASQQVPRSCILPADARPPDRPSPAPPRRRARPGARCVHASPGCSPPPPPSTAMPTVSATPPSSRSLKASSRTWSSTPPRPTGSRTSPARCSRSARRLPSVRPARSRSRCATSSSSGATAATGPTPGATMRTTGTTSPPGSACSRRTGAPSASRRSTTGSTAGPVARWNGTGHGTSGVHVRPQAPPVLRHRARPRGLAVLEVGLQRGREREGRARAPGAALPAGRPAARERGRAGGAGMQRRTSWDRWTASATRASTRGAPGTSPAAGRIRAPPAR